MVENFWFNLEVKKGNFKNFENSQKRIEMYPAVTDPVRDLASGPCPSGLQSAYVKHL